MSYQLPVKNKKGAVLILTFIMLTTLTAITAASLYMTSVQTKVSGYDIASAKALWLAEAGLQKAVWNLMTPVIQGGQGENWTTTGTTESLGDGSYTMVVIRWDFALAVNGASASDSPHQFAPAFGPAKAIDGNDSTHWRSLNRPEAANPQILIITFPYSLTLNKARFLSADNQSQPRDYSWEVSGDGVTYTAVVTTIDNNSIDVTDEFAPAANVKFLRLRITKAGSDVPSTRARVATLEALGSRITSTGTVDVMNRKVEQTLAADDTTRAAFTQQDWNELVPAI